MTQDEDEYEDEIITEICESCGNEGEISSMVDCPRFEQDLGSNGTYPGWIHDYCCEDEFLIDPREYISCCYEDCLFQHIGNHIEKCLDVSKLNKDEIKGVPVLLSEDKTSGLTFEMDRLLKKIKPLQVVTNVFIDKEDNRMFTKDTTKHFNVYSLQEYEALLDRLSAFDVYSPEKFCVKNGPLFLVYRMEGISFGAFLVPLATPDNINQTGAIIAYKYKTKHNEAESFFDVVLEPHSEELKKEVQALTEDEFIKIVLCPLLTKLGFLNVKSVAFHGPGERGGDFRPFYKPNEFGKIIYYSAQAKAVPIHSKSGVKEGNVNQLIDQIKKLFRTRFESFIDNTQKRISFVFVFTSKQISDPAREQLFLSAEERQTICILEIDDIIQLIFEKNLSDSIMAYCQRKK